MSHQIKYDWRVQFSLIYGNKSFKFFFVIKYRWSNRFSWLFTDKEEQVRRNIDDMESQIMIMMMNVRKRVWIWVAKRRCITMSLYPGLFCPTSFSGGGFRSSLLADPPMDRIRLPAAPRRFTRRNAGLHCTELAT